MKKKIYVIIGLGVLLAVVIVTFFNYAKAKGFLIDLVRMPVKGNVIMNCTTINVVNVNVNDNYVDIEAELDSQNESMKAYIITNVEVKKKKEILYIRVYGGYGVGEEFKKFTVNQQFDGEEIKKIVLEGKRGNSEVIWSK